MAKILSSKAKVVLKTTALLILISCSATSQIVPPPSIPERITLHCDACSLASLLAELEQKTGLHFIYSTNIIQVDQQVSVRISEKTIDETLDALAALINLAFKRTARHIIIKNTEKPLLIKSEFREKERSTSAKNKSNPETAFSGGTGPLAFSPASSRAVMDRSSATPPVLRTVRLKNPSALYNQYFKVTELPELPSRYVKPLNLKNSHAGWFLSAGLVMNDYSAGAEFQGGLRSLYFAFRPAWLEDGRYHGSYGLGTSAVLGHNLSLNIIYTLAFVNKEARLSGHNFESIKFRDIVSSSQHHQMRFMLQYPVTPNIMLRGGVSLNYLQTTRFLPELKSGADNRIIFHRTQSSPAHSYASTKQHRVVSWSHAQPLSEIQTSRMWMGWETSVSYKLNFFTRRK